MKSTPSWCHRILSSWGTLGNLEKSLHLTKSWKIKKCLNFYFCMETFTPFKPQSSSLGRTRIVKFDLEQRMFVYHRPRIFLSYFVLFAVENRFNLFEGSIFKFLPLNFPQGWQKRPFLWLPFEGFHIPLLLTINHTSHDENGLSIGVKIKLDYRDLKIVQYPKKLGYQPKCCDTTPTRIAVPPPLVGNVRIIQHIGVVPQF